MEKEITHIDIQKTLKPLIEAIKKQSFTNPKKATDADALGLIVSRYFEWGVEGVFETSVSALEDCNYHPMVAVMREKRKKEK